jgi:hypothetical protein
MLKLFPPYRRQLYAHWVLLKSIFFARLLGRWGMERPGLPGALWRERFTTFAP